MPQGILDILASDISVVGQSDFTVDPTVADVLVNPPGVNGLIMSNASGQSRFRLGDNILIRKLWAVLPWGFGQGGPSASPFSHAAGFDFWDGANLFDIAPIVGDVNIPTLCDPLDFGDGLFCAMATVGGLRQIRLTSIHLRVSQIYAPGILAGTRVAVQYFMEVLHTYGLSV